MVPLDVSKSVTATFTYAVYRLTVIKTGNGSGTVTSEPPGIDCGETCSATMGGVVTLTAVADARSWFHGNQPLIEGTAFRNSSLQGGYFIMAARALGLDTGPMSGFNPDAVNAAFFADQPNFKVNFISTLGYGDPATIFDRSPRPDFDRFNQVI